MDSNIGPDVLENTDEPIDDLKDAFDTDEEEHEDVTMLEDAPMPVFSDMKSYIASPFENFEDDFF